MNEVTYAAVRCTYTELRTADGILLYSLSKSDCAGIVPFAIENYTPEGDEIRQLRCAIARYQSGKMPADNLANFRTQNYAPVAGYGEPTWRNEQTGEFVGASYIMSGAFAKVYLTADGYELIEKLAGKKVAYDISVTDAYVFTPSIQPVEGVTVQVDPEEPDVIKKKETGTITKILLALAGWALFN